MAPTPAQVIAHPRLRADGFDRAVEVVADNGNRTVAVLQHGLSPTAQRTNLATIDGAVYALDFAEGARGLPFTPYGAEAEGFVWSCSFGYPGRDRYTEAYRHPDGRSVWFRWETPDSAPTMSATAA